MKLVLLENNLREYLIIIFRRRFVILTTFITVMVTVVIGLELKTPVYKSSAKMLVSARKEMVSPYLRELGFQAANLTYTESEIVYSYPVLERAVRTLRLDERPSDYEKRFCSPIKSWVVDLSLMMSGWLKPKRLSSEQEKEYVFKKTVEYLVKHLDVSPKRDKYIYDNRQRF